LLHLLPHGVGDLSLQLAENRLDSLTNLLLKRLTQILLRGGGLSLVSTLLLGGPTRFAPLPPVLSPGFWLSLARTALLSAVAVVTS